MLTLDLTAVTGTDPSYMGLSGERNRAVRQLHKLPGMALVLLAAPSQITGETRMLLGKGAIELRIQCTREREDSLALAFGW